MNLLLFMVAIIISLISVRIGAIAFELTGLEWSLAKFQALSCFSGTGFTTKEAELIVGNPQRRRIASVLLVLGNAGLVTLIATFANSLRPATYLPQFTIPFIHLVLPSGLLPWINLMVIMMSLYVVYRFFTHTTFIKKMTRAFKKRLVKKEIIKPVSFEELIVITGGYGVSGIEVCADSSILDKTIREADLRSYGINILVIERNAEAIPNPPADTRIVLGDRLTCFGKLENIRRQLCKIPK